MKKFVSLLLASVLLSSISSCKKTVSEAQGKHTKTPERARLSEITQKLSKKLGLTSSDVQFLEELSENEDFYLRAEALIALPFNNTPEGNVATERIALKKIADKEWLVRNTALNALRRIKSSHAKEIARDLLNDPSPEVRKVAQRIIDENK